MTAKPNALRSEIASRFQDDGVVEAYAYREPYPPEVFDILAELIVDTPRAVLDIGCGRGEVARPLLALADRVDAVDWSEAMLMKGKALPGGDDPRLQWIHGRIEEVDLQPPYALMTAGGSLHWMDWDTLLPRLSGLLTAHGTLALPERRVQRPVWAAEAGSIIRRYWTNPDDEPLDMVVALQKRGLFEKHGQRTTRPLPFTQSVAEHIEMWHSKSYLSRAAMTADAAGEFDAELRSLLARHAVNGMLELQITGSVLWGKPLRPLGN